MFQHKLYPDTAALLGALIKRFAGEDKVIISLLELENAPDVEMKEVYENNTVELRIRES